jgi:hypothetical protein
VGTATGRGCGSILSGCCSGPARPSAGRTATRASRIRRPPTTRSTTAIRPASRPAAESWNSDYLLPDQSFELTLTVPGIYDYYCIPHEHAGMVGRLVVTKEGDTPLQAVVGQPHSGDRG